MIFGDKLGDFNDPTEYNEVEENFHIDMISRYKFFTYFHIDMISRYKFFTYFIDLNHSSQPSSLSVRPSQPISSYHLFVLDPCQDPVIAGTDWDLIYLISFIQE